MFLLVCLCDNFAACLLSISRLGPKELDFSKLSNVCVQILFSLITKGRRHKQGRQNVAAYGILAFLTAKAARISSSLRQTPSLRSPLQALSAAKLKVMELRDALERLEVCQEVAVPGIPRDRHVAGHLVSNWVSLVAPGRLLHCLCQISHAVAIRATVLPAKHPKAAINETAGMTGDHKRQRNGLVEAEHGFSRQVCQHCLVLVLA